jgi:hypothetical protein
MSKVFSFATALMSTLMLTHAFADSEQIQIKAPEIQIDVSDIQLSSQTENQTPRRSPVVKAVFSPFTGRVVANKVRLRLQPDLNGHIVKELVKNDFIKVTNQEGDFYCVEPPESFRAFVFRSFVIDNVVEGNRVNIRLEPDLEAPVIGHLNSGDRVEGIVSEANKKWLEITPPANIHFYVAKEFIEKAGGPDFKAKMESRKHTAQQYFEAAQLHAKSEMTSPFEEINFERVKQGYLTVINDYTDFPQIVESAKEALAQVQDEYLQKRIAYLEQKASGGSVVSTAPHVVASQPTPQGLRMWETVEQGLYSNWASLHDRQEKESFYEDQRLAAATISGVVEPYKTPVKNRPGDYVVKNKNLPVAYIYSTHVNLDDYVGKKVNLICAPRDNHNFAFPAYYVLDVE